MSNTSGIHQRKIKRKKDFNTLKEPIILKSCGISSIAIETKRKLKFLDWANNRTNFIFHAVLI